MENKDPISVDKETTLKSNPKDNVKYFETS